MNAQKQIQVGFLGGGKMAEAIIAGLIQSGVTSSDSIRVCEISADRRNALSHKFSVQVFDSSHEALAESEVVFLAVKPQDIASCLTAESASFAGAPLVISIAAGKPISQLKALLPACRIVRVMPNLAAVVGESMSAYCGEEGLAAEDRACVEQLLSAFGRVLEVPEAQFHAVTAVSGSGPAFFAYLCEAMARGGTAEGLEPGHALYLALQTMLGTAKVLMEQGESPEALIKAVSSPGGTTVAGLEVLRQSAVEDILRETISAATLRSCELGRS